MRSSPSETCLFLCQCHYYCCSGYTTRAELLSFLFFFTLHWKLFNYLHATTQGKGRQEMDGLCWIDVLST